MKDLPQELDDFIKHSIDNTLALPIPENALHLHLQTLKSSTDLLQSQCTSIQSRLQLTENALKVVKDVACSCAKSIRRVVWQIQNLEDNREDLMNKRWKLGKNCHQKFEACEGLMQRKEESDDRVNAANIRVQLLEEKLKEGNEQLQVYKTRCTRFSVDSSEEGTSSEETLLTGLVASLVSETEAVKTAYAFLEDNNELEVCQHLLKLKNSLTPEAQNVLSLAAQLQSLEEDKRNLRINLHRADEEVRVIFEQNNVLQEENGDDSTIENKKRRISPDDLDE